MRFRYRGTRRATARQGISQPLHGGRFAIHSDHGADPERGPGFFVGGWTRYRRRGDRQRILGPAILAAARPHRPGNSRPYGPVRRAVETPTAQHLVAGGRGGGRYPRLVV